MKYFNFQQTLDSCHIQTKELKLHFWVIFLTSTYEQPLDIARY